MQQTHKTSPVLFCFCLLPKREFPHLDTASGNFPHKAHQSLFHVPKVNLNTHLNIVLSKSWITQSGCNIVLPVPYCRGQKSFQGIMYDLFFFPSGINVTGSNMRSESGICVSVRQELPAHENLTIQQDLEATSPRFYLGAICTMNTEGCWHLPQCIASVKSYPI